jgi:Protein of unknown function (DUF3617)
MGTGSNYLARAVLAAVYALALMAPAHAAVPEIKPGLWEVTAKVQWPAPDLAKMTQEERARYESGKAEREERLKQMQQARPICITGEMVSKGHWFGAGRRAADCEFSAVKTTSKTVSYDTACSGQRPSKGKGKLTMVSAEKFTGESASKSEASAREVKITTQGVWKAADCGATTPNYPKVK